MKLVITGIVKNTSAWVEIVQVDADESTTLEQINKGVKEIQDLVGQAFKSGNDGYMTFGDVVISIQSFAALSVVVKE